jgi:hypothetical protein
MSAEIIDIKTKRQGNGAPEALAAIVNDLPFPVPESIAALLAKQLLMELWSRGFKVVPLEGNE